MLRFAVNPKSISLAFYFEPFSICSIGLEILNKPTVVKRCIGTWNSSWEMKIINVLFRIGPLNQFSINSYFNAVIYYFSEVNSVGMHACGLTESERRKEKK